MTGGAAPRRAVWQRLERFADDALGGEVERRYGVVLALLHALTGIAWLKYKRIVTLLSGDDIVCWPLFSTCHRWRPLSTPVVVALVATYLALALTAAPLIARRRATAGLATFAAATLLGSAIYALDYRLRFNQTTMMSWVVVVFFAAPRKRRAVQALLPLFYFWAGTLKLNDEWLSGAALYAKPLFVPAALVPAACHYVVALELVLVWGLFAERAWLRWLTLAQLVLFHVVSFSVVGFFYPILMLALLSIYPLVWRLAPDDTLSWRNLAAKASASSTGVPMAIFSAFQLVPYTFPGDRAVTGEGRLFALHMFDANVACRGGAILTTTSGERRAASLVNAATEVRTRCDPIVLHGAVAGFCRGLRTEGRVDVRFEARRASEPTYRPLIRIDDACRHLPAYSIWRHNPWIGP